MYLCRLEIENFRGIRSARLEFGETTIVIGENDSGKTSILEAICLILSPSPENNLPVFRQHDFFMVNGPGGYRPVGPIKISLTFRERKPDEWSFIRNSDPGITLPDKVNVLQEMTIEVGSSPAITDELSMAHWNLFIEGRIQPGYFDDPAVLSWIRQLNPLFRIKSGGMTDLPEKGKVPASRPGVPENISELDGQLLEKIRHHYENLISGSTFDIKKDLQAGYNAALQYLGKATGYLMQEGDALEQIIYEILGRKSPGKRAEGKNVMLRHGSSAEKIGLMMFTMAFLESGGLMADPSAEPIIIIEDPEAHLHPMTLESVKLLIERLKWQKIITTQSGSLLSGFPLEDIRRISRHEGNVREFRMRPGDLSSEELRRLSYHVRMRLSTATFARCWLLVEGESEVWLLPHIARLCGYDLALEGVVCVEFAQCGIPPLIKAARLLGIQWFLLSDGDAAGKAYIETAKHFAIQSGEKPEDHSMRFSEKDIEHHLFYNGYAGVYQEYSGIQAYYSQNMKPGRIIGRAIHRNSKPFMAVAVIEAMARQNSPGVPQQLRQLIEKCVRLAHGGSR
jgi:putative ATP-dependent endonuclease of the OLD family